MILAATGHRPSKLNNEYSGIGPCSKYICSEMAKILDSRKPEKVYSGMALGVDTLWAAVALTKKIPVIAAIPCDGQEKMWPKPSQDLYHRILKNPLVTSVLVTAGTYVAWKMQARNCYMVDHADELIAVWDGTDGGTANCVNYAKSINKNITIINPTGWRSST